METPRHHKLVNEELLALARTALSSEIQAQFKANKKNLLFDTFGSGSHHRGGHPGVRWVLLD